MASLAVERYGFVESGYVTRAAAFEVQSRVRTYGMYIAT